MVRGDFGPIRHKLLASTLRFATRLEDVAYSFSPCLESPAKTESVAFSLLLADFFVILLIWRQIAVKQEGSGAVLSESFVVSPSVVVSEVLLAMVCTLLAPQETCFDALSWGWVAEESSEMRCGAVGLELVPSVSSAMMG